MVELERDNLKLLCGAGHAVLDCLRQPGLAYASEEQLDVVQRVLNRVVQAGDASLSADEQAVVEILWAMFSDQGPMEDPFGMPV